MVQDNNSYFSFQLFVEHENERNAVYASLLVKFHVNPWFVVNFVGVQKAQAAYHSSTLY